MQYTLDQACKAISATTHAYGTTDTKAAVNKAIQALAGLSGWECLRRVVRIVSAQPGFALPQGCANLVRACINGTPVTIRGQDFQFLHSGPGDISVTPRGYREIPNANIIDRGYHPTMLDPPGPFRLFAISSGVDDPPLFVKGVTLDGEIVRVRLKVFDEGTDPASIDASSADDASPLLSHVVSVTLDQCAEHYVNLYCVDADAQRYSIANYNPSVKAPVFHRYDIQGKTRGSVDILAEVRIDPLPLIEGSDIVPFDTLEPIEWMVQASWCMKSGEIDAAQKLSTMAANWLKAKETVANKVQTIVIANSLYSGSLGEMSADAANI